MPFNRLAGRVLCVSTVLDTYKVRSLKCQQQRQVQKLTNRQTSNVSHECIPYSRVPMVGQAGNQRGNDLSPRPIVRRKWPRHDDIEGGVSTNLGIYPHFREEARKWILKSAPCPGRRSKDVHIYRSPIAHMRFGGPSS
jgi:hypothetical protein